MLLKKYSIYFLLILFCVSAVAVAGISGNGSIKKLPLLQNSTQKSKSLIPYVDGELLVRFVRGVDMNSVNKVASSNSMSVKKRFRVMSERTGNNWVLVKSKGTTEQMILALKNHPTVAAISPNYRRYLAAVRQSAPNDFRYPELWGLSNYGQTGGTPGCDIDALEAWQTNTGSSSVIVAVIDTGVCYDHPDLAANMWQNAAEAGGIVGVDDDDNGYVDDIYGIDPAGADGITPDTDPMDRNGHGTHCSGTIGAVGDNRIGVTGVNWNVKIMALKAFDDEGKLIDDALAIECIEYCIDQKTKYGQNIVAINASWGGSGFNPLLHTAIDDAGAAGIVFCAGAGNNGTDNDTNPFYPSSYTSPYIISVTGTDKDDNAYDGFNYGATSVDIGAPGVDILSTYPKTVSKSIFYDSMEYGSGGWSPGGYFYGWAITSDNEFVEMNGGEPNLTNFWSDSPGTEYYDNSDTYLMNASDIDLTGYVGQKVYLSFDAAWLLDGGIGDDYVYVQLSGSGGGHWDYMFEMDEDREPIQFWQKFAVEIPDDCKTSQFRFSFRLKSDSVNNGLQGGLLVDNVGIGPVSYDDAYERMTGTSMATPHVAGAVALLAAQYASETASERIDRILNNVDPVVSLSGKCVTGGRLNVNRAMNAVGNPSITINTPTDGDILYVTDYTDITWTVFNTIEDEVILSYSTDGGSNYTSIGTVSNIGSYTWIVPDTVTSNGKIKVTSTDGTLVGESGGVFSIQYFTPTVRYNDMAFSVIPSGDGGHILGGLSNGFTAGGYDMLIYKVNQKGHVVWRTNLGGIHDDVPFHMDRTSDGGFLICGRSNSFTNGGRDFILYKIDSNGKFLWKKNFGGVEDDVATCVKETADGGIVLFGHSASYSNGSYDFLIYKLDSSGDTVWQKNFGGECTDWASTVIQTTDGGYAMFGDSGSFTNGGQDFLLYKLDANGKKVARKHYGGTDDEMFGGKQFFGGDQIVQTPDDGYAFTGVSRSYSNGGLDIIVYRIEHNGELLWRKNLGGALDEYSHAFCQTADGGFAIVGRSNSFTNGQEDFVIYKLDSSGNELWRKNYGGIYSDVAYCIYQDADANLLVVGYSVSYVTTPSYQDFLLYKLDSNGNKIGRRNYGR